MWCADYNIESIYFQAKDLLKHNIIWEDKSRSECPKIPYSGMPFVILGSDIRECQFGPDRNVKKKQKYQLNKVYVYIFTCMCTCKYIVEITLSLLLCTRYIFLKLCMSQISESDADHSYMTKGRTLPQNTHKKNNCPARIYLKKICIFPEYQVHLSWIILNFYLRFDHFGLII